MIENLIDKLLSIGPIFIDNSNLFSKYDDDKINSFVVSNFKSKNKVVVIVTDTNSESQLSIDKKRLA